MIDKFGNVEKRKAGDVITETEAQLINDILFLYDWQNRLFDNDSHKIDAFDKLIETAKQIKEEREVVK